MNSRTAKLWQRGVSSRHVFPLRGSLVKDSVLFLLLCMLTESSFFVSVVGWLRTEARFRDRSRWYRALGCWCVVHSMIICEHLKKPDCHLLRTNAVSTRCQVVTELSWTELNSLSVTLAFLLTSGLGFAMEFVHRNAWGGLNSVWCLLNNTVMSIFSEWLPQSERKTEWAWIPVQALLFYLQI